MIRLYEAMFIVDSSRAKDDYDKSERVCLECITRHGGEVVKAIKWDDRRLAYVVSGVKRGTYILVHFNSEGDAIAKIERQVQLSEAILRVMITRDEDGIETTTGSVREQAEAATTPTPASTQQEKAPGESPAPVVENAQ